MDFVKKVANEVGGAGRDGENSQAGGGGKLMDSLNNMAGGGKQGEANEDGLDKGTYVSTLAMAMLHGIGRATPCVRRPSSTPYRYSLITSSDPAVDLVQEKVLGEGDQSNESAAEQAKDEAISDFIRDKYKETTGKDFFIADKDKKYGA
ncbi:uncharacterized protein MAM_03163 [Metarhizium album ARSEF 1941]|uniref:Uncharacterized protein n=1 Tax=Metarhizium album (strain ARSEF 1941) TaxID=1081103 RepID=A0A0B2WRL2_METAS|nr:uncharacterized protein MAM_03163 [Metarhizium album ARSEF 1941]KHN98701.1 hypothetical protein MAM_03163 [Metarhizium album ARSEF 1941]